MGILRLFLLGFSLLVLSGCGLQFTSVSGNEIAFYSLLYEDEEYITPQGRIKNVSDTSFRVESIMSQAVNGDGFVVNSKEYMVQRVLDPGDERVFAFWWNKDAIVGVTEFRVIARGIVEGKYWYTVLSREDAIRWSNYE